MEVVPRLIPYHADDSELWGHELLRRGCGVGFTNVNPIACTMYTGIHGSGCPWILPWSSWGPTAICANESFSSILALARESYAAPSAEGCCCQARRSSRAGVQRHVECSG